MEKEAAQRKKASAELDVADMQDKLKGNQSEWGASRVLRWRGVMPPFDAPPARLPACLPFLPLVGRLSWPLQPPSRGASRSWLRWRS